MLADTILIPKGGLKKEDGLFVNLVEELVAMKNQDRIRFLEFVTAIPRLTPGTQIDVSGQHAPTPMNLPTANTCSYQLNLPFYKTREELGQKLRDAISNGLSSGFHENRSTRPRGISIAGEPDDVADVAPASESPGFALDLSYSTADIGAVVMVQWNHLMHPQWFQGIVNHYEKEKGHYLLYPEDGDMAWHNLRKCRHIVLKLPDSANAIGSKSSKAQ